jgi:hypothetical protein
MEGNAMTIPDPKLILCAVVLAVMTALTACGDGESPAAAEVPAPSGSTKATEPSSASAPANAFEGTWVSDPISREAAAETLNADGMPKAVKAFLAFMDGPGDVAFPADGGTGEGVVISLELQAGQWTALYSVDGSQFETLDTGGTYVTNGPDTLEYTNLGAQVTTLGWTVEDGALEFEWLSGNTVELEGTTEEVIQRVLYTSVPFREQTS